MLSAEPAHLVFQSGSLVRLFTIDGAIPTGSPLLALFFFVAINNLKKIGADQF